MEIGCMEVFVDTPRSLSICIFKLGQHMEGFLSGLDIPIPPHPVPESESVSVSFVYLVL